LCEVAGKPVVAQAIIDDQLEQAAHGYRSPEGSVVAFIDTLDAQPLRVWQYENGQLTDVDKEDYNRARHGDRADWPPFTYSFSFDLVKPGRACVHISTYYGLGRTDTSRGGHTEEWDLRKGFGIWFVLVKTPLVFWD
jgi:hypothetical protein